VVRFWVGRVIGRGRKAIGAALAISDSQVRTAPCPQASARGDKRMLHRSSRTSSPATCAAEGERSLTAVYMFPCSAAKHTFSQMLLVVVIRSHENERERVSLQPGVSIAVQQLLLGDRLRQFQKA